MIDQGKLDELKSLLTTAEDFGDVMDFFFDHFGENPEFLDLGQRVESSLLTLMLERVGEELLGHHVKVNNEFFIQLEKERFVHGTAYVDDVMVVFFFFQDIDMGMLVCNIGSESKFARFTSYLIKSDKPLIIPPNTSRLTH